MWDICWYTHAIHTLDTWDIYAHTHTLDTNTAHTCTQWTHEMSMHTHSGYMRRLLMHRTQHTHSEHVRCLSIHARTHTQWTHETSIHTRWTCEMSMYTTQHTHSEHMRRRYTRTQWTCETSAGIHTHTQAMNAYSAHRPAHGGHGDTRQWWKRANAHITCTYSLCVHWCILWIYDVVNTRLYVSTHHLWRWFTRVQDTYPCMSQL